MRCRTHLPLCLTLAALAAFAGRATAHPAASVVVDAKGNAYYSDLEKVWRVAPDGKKQVVASGVHTHELSLDSAGNLYGEHLWYEGETTDKWGHYVWRLSPAGRVDRVSAAREGFRTDWSFVTDSAGRMYWAEARRSALDPRGRPARRNAPAAHRTRRRRARLRLIRCAP